MVEVWSGDILLPDGNTVKDVGLASPNVTLSPTLPPTALRFLSAVDTAKIPLYLAAGTSFDVWTTCEATEEWFDSILLSKSTEVIAPSNAGKDWWALARSQSPIGILVRVQTEDEGLHKPRVTEILFYGTIAPPSAAAGLPTPPWSSPERHDSVGEQLPQLRVHALPLSSDQLYQIQSTSPSSTVLCTADGDENVEPQFLPQHLNIQATPSSPKRKRDIFEEATIAQKKARGKGGAGVAAAAARGSESQMGSAHRKSLSIDTKSPSFPDNRPLSANSALSRPASRQLSRSPSISSDTRPLSRKGLADGHSKRSTLSQVATVSLQSEEPTTESRNKEALSKVVMAAMRMHGLQQRKKTRSRRTSVAPGVEEEQHLDEVAAAEDAAKDDEYKLVYHQTYKAAAFALRKDIIQKPLHAQPDRLRDVVEKLLAIFLSDPLAQPLPNDEATNVVATPGSKSHLGVPGTTHSHTSPFDLPSATRPGLTRSKTDNHIYTGSPVSKRKDGDGKGTFG
ncbi:hypothetical protein EK21DRAFT_69480 [Setomelanomma holmii]|uniref:Sld7 C-terminal domain-containing protein n=1 Tax=Setomelanomma holmii TaxID=210430 RepID=A0A9P4H7H0_9PLEO|nr:hypothetical protein EK21DRAFT_69480 [Setomelanomma holmii]